MPVLPNNKHELFAQSLAKGLSADAAYQAAGYKPNRGNAATLKANQSISKRVEELQAAAAAKTVLSRQWVIERLVENVERAMQAVPVLDHDGNPTGEYTYEGNVANRALELLGKEIGMFVGRREDDLAMTLRVAIDAPPDETREQWLARTARERGLPPAIVGAAVGSANGGSDSQQCHPERAKATKSAIRERLRGDEEWLKKERERRRKRDKERRRKDRTYRRDRRIHALRYHMLIDQQWTERRQ